MKNVTGIDWLSFSGYFRKGNQMCDKTPVFQAERRNYGTRNFSEVWDIYYMFARPGKILKQRAKFGQLCCKPQSRILNENLVNFKLENDLLYTDHWFLYLLCFIDDFKLQEVKISRVDLFRDFQTVDYKQKDQDPQVLIKDIAAGKITKKGGAKYTIFADVSEGGAYAVTYGSILSGRQLAIYNKTKELAEVHDKPYIRKMWQDAGFDSSRPTYRAEVRIQKRGLELFDLECQETTKLNLKQLYEYSIAPALDGYFNKVAIFRDAKEREYNPFIISTTDPTNFPFIPKFRSHVHNPNPKQQAKNVLKWAEDVKEDIEKYNFECSFHEKTKQILADFIWLLQTTIPESREHVTKCYRDEEYERWIFHNANNIRHYIREYKPDIIPVELFTDEY